MNKRKGFTLMEVIFTVVIVSVLAAFILPRIIYNMSTSIERSCFQDVQRVNQQVELWNTLKGAWPQLDLNDIAQDPQFFPDGVPACPVTDAAYFLDDTHRIVAHLNGNHEPDGIGGGGNGGGGTTPMVTWGYPSTIIMNAATLEGETGWGAIDPGFGNPGDLLWEAVSVLPELLIPPDEFNQMGLLDLGAGHEEGRSIQQTFDSDGNSTGYIVVGQTSSSGAGKLDAYIAKLDLEGTVEWSRTLGGSNNDTINSIQQTFDGVGNPTGYILAGLTQSFGAAGWGKMFVTKLLVNPDNPDPAGRISVGWSNCYGDSELDTASSIRQTFDSAGDPSGFVMTGGTGGMFAGANIDVGVIKINDTGQVQWGKALGGNIADTAVHAEQTFDGLGNTTGYIIAGNTYSYSGDINNKHMFITKLAESPAGGATVEWSKVYGGNGSDTAHHITQVFDRAGDPAGYMIAGGSTSAGSGSTDATVTKIDLNGNVRWSKTFGGAEKDYAESIQRVFDESGRPTGYIVGRNTYSFGAGSVDQYLIKLVENSAYGSVAVEWSKSYGGSDKDVANFVQQTKDGGYVIAGLSSSFVGGTNVYILKTDDSGLIDLDCDGTIDPPVNE